MRIDKDCMVELAQMVADAVVISLEKTDRPHKTEKKGNLEKTAYQKTEQLLWNYNGFKRIVREKQLEIEEIRAYGVPQSCGKVTERVQGGTVATGIVLPEESVEAAIRSVEASVQSTVEAIALIDKCMYALRNDPYYKVLEMLYFEGRTQEDIAVSFKCSQVTISKNKSRLVRELSMRLFPDQVVSEMLK